MTKMTSASTAPVGFSDVPVSEERFRRLNPDSNIANAEAFRTVTLQIISEAFDLYDEEQMWVSYHLDTTFAPLMDLRPHMVPVSVRQEMLDGTYSRLIELRSKAKSLKGQTQFDKATLHASAEEWTDALLDQVFSCYTLRPLTESSMRGDLLGIFRELGVGDAKNPRGASFLPNDLRLELRTSKPSQLGTATS